MSFSVSRIDHAVYWVKDVERSRDFYMRMLGLQLVMCDSRVCLLRAQGSEQHHDMGLFQTGSQAPRAASGTVGLYHIAWKVKTIEDLAQALSLFQAEGFLVGASSHGATKSVYAHDPDGNELEITFTIPRCDWGEWENGGTVESLDIAAELIRYGKHS
jgi:catechol-2,3-dioxygenase